MFDLRARQDLNRGFSDALARSIEMVATPLIFVLIGWGIDRLAGTSPIFLVVLATFGVAGMAVKMKLGYDRDMALHDGSAATRPRQVAPAATDRGSAR